MLVPVAMFSCAGCGGHYGFDHMCEDCGMCVGCCFPGCACDACLSNRD